MSHRTLVLAIFFVSGFCGLVYEVVWLRHLSLVFGNTVYATSTVLAGFMGGLAIGSYLFGKVADKIKKPLQCYGIIEILIGLLGLSFPTLLKMLVPTYIWMSRISASSYECLSVAQSILLVGLIAVPSTLMGGSLPLVAKYLIRGHIGRNVSFLYGVNTLGAVTGCATAGFILIGAWGVSKTTWLAVGLNLLIGCAAVWLGRNDTRTETDQSKAVQEPIPSASDEPMPAWLSRLLLVLFVISGFTAMGYEVLWTRVLSFVAGTTTYSFTVMLTTYLLGLALGSVLTARWIDKSTRLVETFGVLQLLTGLGVLATLVFTPAVLQATSHALFNGDKMRYSTLTSFVTLHVVSSVYYILPFTLLTGMAFPIVAKLYSTSRHRIGSGVGTSYFADTIGTIGGSLVAGFLLIPHMGTLSGVRFLAFINLAIGAVAVVFKGWQMVKSPAQYGLRIGASAVMLAAVIFLAQRNIPENTFTGIFTAGGATLDYIDEDIGGTVTVENYGDHRTISINGINVAGTDLKFETTQKLQAHLALLLHPNPKRVLQIGFGSGGTAWSITRHPVDEIDCVELTAAVIKANPQMRDSNHNVLADPRVHVCIDDARSYLLKTDAKYDAILSDSIHPRYVGNGGLYAVDYFQLCKQRLNTNGIFSAWLPLYGLSLDDFRVAVRSLKAVFPHVYLFHSPMGRTEWTIILGTLRPLEFDIPEMERRFNTPTVRNDLKVIHVNRIEDIIDCFDIGDANMKKFLGASKTLNTDDFPYLEYVAPRSGLVSSREELLLPLYREFLACREDVLPYLKNSSDRPEIQRSFNATAPVLQGRLVEMEHAGDKSAAAALYKQALQLDPQNSAAENLLGH